MEGKNRSLSYSEWLSQNAAPYDGEAERSLATKRAVGSPDYGAAAETLSDRGLSRTGYAKYLRERNEAAYRSGVGAIREKNVVREANNRSGYLAYLKQWERDQDELMRKTLSSLAESKVPGVDDAYADALSAGLSDDRAQIVARIAPAIGQYGARRLGEGIAGVLSVSVRAGLSGAEAELLARACGISESDAKKLRKTVEASPSGSAASDADRWE